jgi:hypothetical protein
MSCGGTSRSISKNVPLEALAHLISIKVESRGRADVAQAVADEIVRGRKPGQVGHGLHDARLHTNRRSDEHLAACVDGLDPSESSALAMRSMYGQRRSTKYCAPASLPEDQVVRIAGTVEARSTAELEKGSRLNLRASLA